MGDRDTMFFVGRWKTDRARGASSFFVMEIEGRTDKAGLSGERYDRYGLAAVRGFTLLPSGELEFKIEYDQRLSRGGSESEIQFKGRRTSNKQYTGDYVGEPGVKGTFDLEYIENPGDVLQELLRQRRNLPLGKISI